MKLSIIVLASGNSRRFNGNKLLYEIDNKPMYLHTVDKLIDLKKSNENVDEIIFVTKYDKIIDNLKNKDIKVVKNNNRMVSFCKFNWLICKSDVKKYKKIGLNSAFFT